MNKRILELLQFLYGSEVGKETFRQLELRVQAWQREIEQEGGTARARYPKIDLSKGQDGDALGRDNEFPLSERDSIVIMYGDQFQKPGMKPLQLLREFSRIFLEGTVTGLHILPFSPYSSDDGFSVIDYRQVNPEWGIGKIFRSSPNPSF